MSQKVLEYLEQLPAVHPDLADDIADLANLYQRKLWHQLSLKVEECLAKPQWNKGSLPIQLYDNFISDFGHKINLLKFSQFSVQVSKHLQDSGKASAFLQNVEQQLREQKLPRSDEPQLFLQMHIAQYKLESGLIQDCKGLIEEGNAKLDTLADVDPSVSAAVYYVSSLYYKFIKDYAEFYRSSLMYLSYVSSDALDYDFKLALAVDISLAALLGEHIYSFAQLLTHPIVKVLDSSTYQWLHDLLECFNRGDLHLYDQMCRKFARELNSQPALVENERKLREKITIMCLMAIISALPAESRKLPLQLVAEKTKLSVDGVEFLLMKALSLHLVEGFIDEVDSEVQISWVQPTILTNPQIQGLKDRLDGWLSKVQAISSTLEQDTVGVADV